MAQWAGKHKRAGPPQGFGSPQEEKGADGQAPTGKAEQMAQRIMEIQLCSQPGRLWLEEGRQCHQIALETARPERTAYAKGLPVWRLWNP